MKIALFAQCMYAPWIEWIKNNSLLLANELSKEVDLTIISHAPREKIEDISLKNLNVEYILWLDENPMYQVFLDIIGAIRSVLLLYKKNISLISFQYLERSFILPMILVAIFKCDTKFALTLYSTDELHIWYKRLFLKIFRRKFKKIIIISEYLREFVLELGFRDDTIVYIPLSYDKERYWEYAAFEKRDKKTILFSAGIHKDAGSFFMVDLAKTMPDYHFVFALRKFNKKSEDELEKLQEYISASEVKNIDIQRNIKHMETLLGEVSCLILPLQDIRIKMLIPVALLEAMWRGTISFVSDLPNLELLIKDNHNAIVFSRKNIFDLQEKIRIFLTRKDVSENAFHFAKNFPDYCQIADSYKKLFTSIS